MATGDAGSAAAASVSDHDGIGGHPKGLMTLFFTEMWERFSYYGMRAFLILFLEDSKRGGLGLPVARSGRIYGLYTAAVYIASLPGGWIADRFLGLRQAVFVGGVIIMLGHVSLALVQPFFIYLGLFLVVVGTGLLKPNVSAMVGELYDKDDPRKDRGYYIYYMGINVGALAGPLVAGTLAERVSWHWGFGAAAIGMLVGLVQYRLGRARLRNAGLLRTDKSDARKLTTGNPVLWAIGMGLIFIAVMPDWITPLSLLSADGTASTLTRLITISIGSTAFIGSLYAGAGFTDVEKRRGLAIYALFWCAVVFWSGFEQAGSSLNLFAARHTDLNFFGWDLTVTSFQSLNPWFIILLAPLFTLLWPWLRRRNLEPSSPAKFGFGPVFVGLGFVLMVMASQMVVGGSKVGPEWLTATYFLHTVGELCLSPVGLSLMTKLAPEKIVGQIFGVWFLASAVGNYMGGEVASFFEALPLPELFGYVTAVSVAAGLLMFAFVPQIRKLMGGVR